MAYKVSPRDQFYEFLEIDGSNPSFKFSLQLIVYSYAFDAR